MARGLGPVGACVSPVPLRAAPRSLALSCFEQQRVGGPYLSVPGQLGLKWSVLTTPPTPKAVFRSLLNPLDQPTWEACPPGGFNL